ncbi:MAG: RNA polymerase sigma factor RpoH, partial [Gammaproteobacteria bacterium]|nr:RNA polymerase sigma factor RpoH [Gammaproteobacteria bacterium]
MTQTMTSHALVSNSLPVPSPIGSLDAYIGA